VISAGSGTLGEVLLAISFVPFLVYFMLTWKDHAHSVTVRLFPKEHRLIAHRTVARISAMIRSFIAGNVVVGLMNALVSMVVFRLLGIPYFYFLGVLSGFVSLIPYLGVFLALLPPLAGSVGIVGKSGAATIVLTVVGLHVVTMHVLYSKIVGKRLRLKPAGGDSLFAFLGVDLGRDGLHTRRTVGGSHQDHLRLRRLAARTGGLVRRLSPIAHDFGWQSWYLPATSIAGEYAVVLKARDAQMDARSSQAPKKDVGGWQRRARSCSAATRLL
jgi:hypothetical protein